MDDAQTDAPKWTPDQPLPAGATDDQFIDRRLWLRYHGPFGREDEIARAERAGLASPRAPEEPEPRATREVVREVHPDTVRLDWLDAQREAEWHAEQRSETEVEQVLDYFYWQTRGQCNDIRTAIDNDERRAKLPKPPMTDADHPF